MIAATNERSEELQRAPRSRGRLALQTTRMILTARDQHIIRWVHENGLATRAQLQRLFFGAGGRSQAQARLTRLYRNRYLDKLPGRALNTPDVYYLSARTRKGLALLRAMGTDEEIRPFRPSAPLVQHVLDIGSVRVQVVKACEASGFVVERWLSEAQVRARTEQFGLVPDCWFQIERPTEAGPKTASFFGEIERSAKSDAAYEEKFRRLARCYYGTGEGGTGSGYEQAFHTRALRVLILVGSDYGIRPERRIARVSSIAAQLGVTIVRLTPLSTFLALDPAQLWTSPIWTQPGRPGTSALF
jgi:hypothetical protein